MKFPLRPYCFPFVPIKNEINKTKHFPTCTMYRSYWCECLCLEVARNACRILLDFSLTVKAVPHECVIRTSQP